MARRRFPRARGYVRRRHSRRSIVAAVIALIVAIASLVDRGLRASRAPSVPGDRSLDGKAALVTRVADGDTIEVRPDGSSATVRVRLIGVDAPELSGPSADLGKAAADYARTRCEGKTVTLRLDELQREHDKYGRLLAYVHLPDHELLNQALVRDGMAFAYRPTPCDLSQQFEAAEGEARRAKRGLWRMVTTEQMPEWRRQWMAGRGIK